MQASEFDEARFFAALASSGARALGMVPTCTPEQARIAGRYVLENDEHVDVLVARSVATVDGVAVAFDEVWTRRVELEVGAGVTIEAPALDDLILTKRFGARPRDADDIRMLVQLREARR